MEQFSETCPNMKRVAMFLSDRVPLEVQSQDRWVGVHTCNINCHNKQSKVRKKAYNMSQRIHMRTQK